MRVDGAVKSLLKGVSTLPLHLQPPGFASEQLNFRADKNVGLTRRQGTEYIPIEKLVNSPSDISLSDSDLVQPITISGMDWWLVLRAGREFLLIDPQGRSQATAYLNGAEGYADTATVVAASRDIGIIANNNRVPQMDTHTLRPNSYVSFIHCSQALSDADAPIVISFRESTDANGDAVRASITVPYVADEPVVALADRIALLIGVRDEIEAVTVGATVTIHRTAACTFDTYTDITVSGAPYIYPINGTITDIAELPSAGPYLEIVELIANGTNQGMFLRLEGIEATEGGEEPPVEPPVPDEPVVITQTRTPGQDNLDHQIRNPSDGSTTNDTYGRILGDLSEHTTLTTWGDVAITPETFKGATIRAIITSQTQRIPARPVLGTIGQLHLASAPTNIPLTGIMFANVIQADSGILGERNLTGTFVRNYEAHWNSAEVYDFVLDEEGVIIDDWTTYTITPATTARETFSEARPAQIAAGTWRETSAPGEPYIVEPATIPHVLVRDLDTWVIKPSEGVRNRNAGSAENNPLPFDKPIKDIAFAQDRLISATGPDIVMSQTRNYANYFQQTMAQLLENDAVSISHTSTRDMDIDWLVPHRDGVTAFNKLGQYKVSGTAAITPETAALPHSGTFPYAERAKPVSGGAVLFFPNSFGDTSGINLMGVQSGRDLVETVKPLTQQCTKFITGSVEFIEVEPILGIIVVKCYNDHGIYLGEMVNDTVAWSRHELGGNITIRGVRFIGSTIQLLITVQGSLSLVNLPLAQSANDAVYLDYKGTATGVTTSVTIPPVYPIEANLVVVQGEGCPYPGDVVTFTRVGDVLELDESMLGGTVTYGAPYDSVYTPSQLVVRDSGGSAQQGANLRILEYVATLVDTGSLWASILTPHYDFPDQEYHSNMWDNIDSNWDDSNVNDSEFHISFKQPANAAKLRLHTNHNTPCTISSLEWQGAYNKRGRRF